MPLPEPSPNTPKTPANKQKFISRCAGDPRAVKEFPDQKQRLAYCYSVWERRKKKASVAVQIANDEYLSDDSVDLTDEEIAQAKSEAQKQ